MSHPLLAIEGFGLTYATPRGSLNTLHDVTFSIEAGEAVALVGESGSGKSTIALAIMGLLGAESDRAGAIHLKGRDLAAAGEAERRALRGPTMGMVFQDPFTSLNPSLTIGRQIVEPCWSTGPEPGCGAGAGHRRPRGGRPPGSGPSP